MSIEFKLEYSWSVAPAALYAALAEPQEHKSWVPGLDESMFTSGAGAVGSLLEQTRSIDGTPSTEVFEVIVAAPGQSYATRLVSGEDKDAQTEYHFVYDLESDGEKTHLTVACRLESQGPTWTQSLVLSMLRGRLQTDLAALEKHLTR